MQWEPFTSPRIGAMRIELTGKEEVGGQTGLVCKLYTKEKDKPEELAWGSALEAQAVVRIA